MEDCDGWSQKESKDKQVYGKLDQGPVDHPTLRFRLKSGRARNTSQLFSSLLSGIWVVHLECFCERDAQRRLSCDCENGRDARTETKCCTKCDDVKKTDSVLQRHCVCVCLWSQRRRRRWQSTTRLTVEPRQEEERKNTEVGLDSDRGRQVILSVINLIDRHQSVQPSHHCRPVCLYRSLIKTKVAKWKFSHSGEGRKNENRRNVFLFFRPNRNIDEWLLTLNWSGVEIGEESFST